LHQVLRVAPPETRMAGESEAHHADRDRVSKLIGIANSHHPIARFVRGRVTEHGGLQAGRSVGEPHQCGVGQRVRANPDCAKQLPFIAKQRPTRTDAVDRPPCR
jgi:hypothetical protein